MALGYERPTGITLQSFRASPAVFRGETLGAHGKVPKQGNARVRSGEPL